MRLYLIGPMRGLPDDNKAAFDEAAVALRAAGHEVCVPYELDILLPEGTPLRQRFAASVHELCRRADGGATLEGTGASRGSLAEIACAAAVDIPVRAWREWL